MSDLAIAWICISGIAVVGIVGYTLASIFGNNESDEPTGIDFQPARFTYEKTSGPAGSNETKEEK